MKRTSILLLALLPVLANAATFQVRGTEGKPWTKILGSLGFDESAVHEPAVVVAGGEDATAAALAEKHILVVVGNGPLAEKFGIAAQTNQLRIRQICDVHGPDMQIIWDEPVSVPLSGVPSDFVVFAREKWKSAPVIAGKRTAHGAVLWLAVPPGASGIERFPYLPQALSDLGLTPAAESTALWAFFDGSYRTRADSDYLAKRWRRAGISVLHVAAWHNVEPDNERDNYLKQLIEACHRNAISVYAWLELPHVSETFWAAHPEWREKTAVGQDAHLDWRKLMNLQNPQCRAEIAKQVSAVLKRFDWDGVNLAELYFESLEGASNPARFTPMNDDVRHDFERTAGWDPKLLWDEASPYSMKTHADALKRFLDYRADIAAHMQKEWLETIDKCRAGKPYLDVVLTHIDDRFDPAIRDELGADVARTIPVMQARKGTLLVEDPAPLWSLGPERYAKLADKYQSLTPDRSQLAVDINVVERYQDVYPTKKQTGVELFELVHQAAVSFGRVALYFENSLEKQDLAMLPAAAANARVEDAAADELKIDASETTRIAWQGAAEVDGKLWPVQDDRFVFTPAGKHTLSAAVQQPAMTVRDFNGQIQSAVASRSGTEIAYQSKTRAIAVLDSEAASIEVDGEPFARNVATVLLPQGQHVVSFSQALRPSQ
jgi:hypothetical protein